MTWVSVAQAKVNDGSGLGKMGGVFTGLEAEAPPGTTVGLGVGVNVATGTTIGVPEGTAEGVGEGVVPAGAFV